MSRFPSGTLRVTWPLLRASAFLALLVYAGVVSISVANLRSRVRVLEEDLWARGRNSLLLEQQIDRLFEAQSQRWRSGAPLVASDLASLQVWLTFDSAFALRNRTDRSLRCEVALTHRRSGLCALLLGDCRRSIEHTRASIRLYDDLAGEHPSSPDYRADVAATKVLLGEALEASGETREAMRAYREAIAVLGAPGFPRTDDDDRRLVVWQEHVQRLALTQSTGGAK